MTKRWTPGPWRWWTSNSWRRLSSDHPEHRREGCVLCPIVQRSDGHPDIIVTDGDMALIAAAPELYEALADAKITLEEAAKLLAPQYPSVANNIVNQCAIRCGDALAKARGETP